GHAAHRNTEPGSGDLPAQPRIHLLEKLMLTRRRFVGYSALSSAALVCRPLLQSGWAEAAPAGPLRVAILGSTYRYQSQMQMLADRFLVGYPLEGEWHQPQVKVVSVYVDQLVRQVEAAPSPYELAMQGAKLAPSSAAKGIAGGLGKDRAVSAQQTDPRS